MIADTFHYRAIGIIRSRHIAADRTPIQPVYAECSQGRAEIFPEYTRGLKDIEGFSHLYLLYHFHRAGPAKLTVKPYLQDVKHGVFATRAPNRPNPIGQSIVRLVRREGSVLWLEDVDVLDGTPLLDIKPYIPRFDRVKALRSGWQSNVDEQKARELGGRYSIGERKRKGRRA